MPMLDTVFGLTFTLEPTKLYKNFVLSQYLNLMGAKFFCFAFVRVLIIMQMSSMNTNSAEILNTTRT